MCIKSYTYDLKYNVASYYYRNQKKFDNLNNFERYMVHAFENVIALYKRNLLSIISREDIGLLFNTYFSFDNPNIFTQFTFVSIHYLMWLSEADFISRTKVTATVQLQWMKENAIQNHRSRLISVWSRYLIYRAKVKWSPHSVIFTMS